MSALTTNPSLPPLLELQQVSVVSDLGQHTILTDVSFRLFTGDRIGLVGASGSGKTTLLRLLNRLQDPSSGRIYTQGQPLTDRPVLTWRQQAVLVSQTPKLLGMTVQETLAYPLRLRQMAAPKIQEQVQMWRQRLAIPAAWMSRTEAQLSLGERQLVCLARACGADPSLLLLDEPMSGLDGGRVAMVQQALQQWPGTVVMASHQLALLEQLCDRILWLDGGHLIADQAAADFDWTHLKTTLDQQAQAIVDDDWD